MADSLFARSYYTSLNPCSDAGTATYGSLWRKQRSFFPERNAYFIPSLWGWFSCPTFPVAPLPWSKGRLEGNSLALDKDLKVCFEVSSPSAMPSCDTQETCCSRVIGGSIMANRRIPCKISVALSCICSPGFILFLLLFFRLPSSSACDSKGSTAAVR